MKIISPDKTFKQELSSPSIIRILAELVFLVILVYFNFTFLLNYLNPNASDAYAGERQQLEATYIGGLATPLALDISGNSLIYVADAGSGQVQVFDADGVFIKKWGNMMADEGVRQDPVGDFGSEIGGRLAMAGIAVSSDRKVYLIDTTNNLIRVFDDDGNEISHFGETGADPGMLSRPHGIALSPSGFIFVADTGNNRIQVFTTNGQYVSGWELRDTRTEQIGAPWDIAINEHGELYITDSSNGLIWVYDDQGEFINKYGQNSEGVHLQNPKGIALDSAGNIYVADSGNNRIAVFGADGKVMKEIIGAVTGDTFTNPQGVAVTDRSIYVLDTGNNRIAIINKGSLEEPIRTGGEFSSISVEMSTSSALISWTGDKASETGFIVEHASNARDFVTATTTVSNINSVRLNDLRPNSLYYFRVASYNNSATSSYINATGVYTLATAPTDFKVSSEDKNSLVVYWQSIANEYYIENISARTNSGWIKNNNYKFTDLKCGTKNSFRVKARNFGNIETSWSEAITVSAQACADAAIPVSPIIDDSVPAVINIVASVGGVPGEDPSPKRVLNISSVSNVSKVAVSDDKSFSASSWENYKPGNSIELPKDNTSTVYVKFLSPSGAESKVITVENTVQENKPNASGTTQAAKEAESVTTSKNNSSVTQASKTSTSEIRAAVPKIFSTASPSIKIGKTGSEVKVAQTILKSLGYFNYYQATGYFGPITLASVMKFQVDNKLPATGVIGPLTKKALENYSTKAIR